MVDTTQCEKLKTWKADESAPHLNEATIFQEKNDDPYYSLGSSYTQGYEVSKDQIPIWAYEALKETTEGIQDPTVLLKHFSLQQPYLTKGVKPSDLEDWETAFTKAGSNNPIAWIQKMALGSSNEDWNKFTT